MSDDPWHTFFRKIRLGQTVHDSDLAITLPRQEEGPITFKYRKFVPTNQDIITLTSFGATYGNWKIIKANIQIKMLNFPPIVLFHPQRFAVLKSLLNLPIDEVPYTNSLNKPVG